MNKFSAGMFSSGKSATLFAAMPWLVLLGCIAVNFLGYRYVEGNLNQKKIDYFQSETEDISNSLVSRIEQYEAVLGGVQALFAASNEVEEDEWAAFIDKIEVGRRYPGLVSVGYVVHARDTGRDVVTYISMADGVDRQIQGLDFSRNRDLIPAMESARDEGAPCVSAPLNFDFGADSFRGNYVFLPIYQNAVPTSSLDERRAALSGWIFGIFDYSLLLRDLLATHGEEIDFEIFDGDTMDVDRLIYDDDASLHAVDPNYHATFSRTTRFQDTGRERTIYFTTLSDFESIVDTTVLKVILGGGSALTLFLFFFVRMLVSTRANAVHMAERMMRALTETMALQRAILDGANFSIISTDTQGIIVTFNKGAEKLLGYRADEVVFKKTPAIIHDPKEVAARAAVLSRELGRTVEPGFEAFVARAQQLSIADENEWTYIRKDGSRFPVMLSVTALRGSDGKLTGYLGIAYDLTERKKIERMKNEFVSTVSHELRTPLTSIRGSLGLIAGGKAGELSPQAKPLVSIALNNCERLVRLINDILDIEKMDSGTIEFKYAEVDLVPFLARVIQANEGFAKQYNVRFMIGSRDQALVYADPDRLTQVVTNLLSNAAKFSPNGEAVTVTVVRTGRTVRVSISDKGRGIPEEFKGKIFQKFAQADSSDTRQKGGTGLGLNIARSIVEKLGGRIGFQTEVGKGTTFFFELPVYERADVSAISGAISSKPRARILVCEDDPDVCQLLSLILAQHGFETDKAYTAAQAKELLALNHYAGMTLDIALPDVDGLTLLKSLREDHKTRDLPVVVVSAKAQIVRDQINGGAVGIIDWINKPIDEERVVSALNLALRRSSGQRPRILHVEDDVDTARIVSEVIKGFADVVHVTTVAEARRILAEESIDLILLDLQLPDGSGLALLSETPRRGSKPIPVVVFSATDTDHEVADIVSLTLLKSTTSNEKLIDSIKSLLDRQGVGTS